MPGGGMTYVDKPKYAPPKVQDPKLLQLYALAKLRKDKVQMAYLEKRIC